MSFVKATKQFCVETKGKMLLFTRAKIFIIA